MIVFRSPGCQKDEEENHHGWVPSTAWRLRATACHQSGTEEGEHANIVFPLPSPTHPSSFTSRSVHSCESLISVPRVREVKVNDFVRLIFFSWWSVYWSFTFQWLFSGSPEIRATDKKEREREWVFKHSFRLLSEPLLNAGWRYSCESLIMTRLLLFGINTSLANRTMMIQGRFMSLNHFCTNINFLELFGLLESRIWFRIYYTY